MSAAAPGGRPRGRLAETLRGEAARRLVAYVGVGLVVALITGPDGAQGHYSFGFTHSLLRPRVIPFVLAAVAVWAAVQLGPGRGQGARRVMGHRRFQLMEARGRLTRDPRARYGGYTVLLVAAVVIPPALSPFWQTVLVNEIGTYALLALGLNVVVGFAGLLDLGYIAFYAIGAYTTAYFTGRLPVHPPFDLNPFFILPIAVLAALAAGVLLGAPTLRLRGDYLAIVTLGFGEIVYQFALIKTDITGGSSGAFNIPHFSVHVGGLSYAWGLDSLPYYYLLLVFVVVVLVLFRRLENSRVGRAWAAIREDEVAAAATGVPTMKYKLMAFGIGASTSGLAGVLYASKVSTVTPDAFLLQSSILVLVLVIFGGMGSIWGALFGAALLQWLPEALRDYVRPADRFIYFGALLIVMMIFRPEGLLPSRRRAREIAMAEAGIDEADALTVPPGAPVQERS